MRTLAVLVAFAAVSASSVLGPPSAVADTPGCVTKAEWRRVFVAPDGEGAGSGDGRTMARVHRVFDTAGERVDFFSDGFVSHQVRAYPRCGSSGTRQVAYQRVGSGAWWSYRG